MILLVPGLRVLNLLSTSIEAAENPATSEPGRAVFERWCVACHGRGSRRPDTMALAAKYEDQKPALLEQRANLDCEMLKYFVRNGVSVIPFFRKPEVSDANFEALAT